jgi:hypothetical protein
MTTIPRLAGSPRRGGTMAVVSTTVLAMCLAFASLARADAVVTLCHTADDPGAGVNLRNALRAAPDPNSLINTITFHCNGAATIQVSGPLEISQATKIDGGDATTLITSSTSTHESIIVVANPGHFLFLYNLTLRHPNATPMNCTLWLTNGCTGSVINAQGGTELHHVFVDSSHIPVSITSGTLGIFDSQFMGNSEAVIAAAPSVTTTTIDHTVFQNNVGAAPIEASGKLSITHSQFTNNGGMDLEGTCQLTMDADTFQNNNSNGALISTCDSTISHSIFSHNSSTISGGAIGFGASARQIVLRADKFLNNSSTANGGALFFQVPLNLQRTISLLYSTFNGNKATSGGAIEIGFVIGVPGNLAKTLIDIGMVSFSHNLATADGGALHGQWTELQIARAVFADNKASGHGGAVALSNSAQLHSRFGNTLFVRNIAPAGSAFFGDDAEFINSTVDSNQGLAISNVAPRTPIHIRLTNSIVSNNPQGGCGRTGLFDDGGKNLQFPGSDCGTSITVADPHLDTMYIPIPKSPPIGFGDATICMSSPINGRDVYGVGRPSGDACTTGAAEGDIQALLHRRISKSLCNCDSSLIEQLQRLLAPIP